MLEAVDEVHQCQRCRCARRGRERKLRVMLPSQVDAPHLKIVFLYAGLPYGHVCVCVYYCSTFDKAVRVGGGWDP